MKAPYLTLALIAALSGLSMPSEALSQPPGPPAADPASSVGINQSDLAIFDDAVDKARTGRFGDIDQRALDQATGRLLRTADQVCTPGDTDPGCHSLQDPDFRDRLGPPVPTDPRVLIQLQQSASLIRVRWLWLMDQPASPDERSDGGQ